MKRNLSKMIVLLIVVTVCMCTVLNITALAMSSESEKQAMSTKVYDQVVFQNQNGGMLSENGKKSIVLTQPATIVGYRILPYQGQPTGYTIKLAVYKANGAYSYETVWADGRYHEMSKTFNLKEGDTVVVQYSATQVYLNSVVVIFG